METTKLNEELHKVLKEEYDEIPLCTNDDPNVRETGYLTQFDADLFDEDDFEDDEATYKKIVKADGKYIVSFANFTYVDTINEGDVDEILSIVAKTPQKAMELYWKQTIDFMGLETAQDWWNDFEAGDSCYWEDTDEAQQFRDIGAKVLKIEV